MENERHKIPRPVKRAVRQRCGYGCVICGRALYQYDHIHGYKEGQIEKPEDLVILCENHHSEKTKGLLPLAAVLKANDYPYNKRAGQSAPYFLHYDDDKCGVVLGSNRFITYHLADGEELVGLMIDGVPMIGFEKEDGNLLLNLTLFDEMNTLVLQIEQNSLTYSPALWDVEFVGRRLTIRQDLGKMILDIIFNPPNLVNVEEAHFIYNGVEVEITDGKLTLLNLGNSMRGCLDMGYSVIGLSISDGKSGTQRPALVAMDVPQEYRDRSKWPTA